MLRFLALVVCFLSPAILVGQAPSWKLPEGSVVRFEAVRKSRSEVIESSQKPAPRGYSPFATERYAPVLLQSALDPEQRFLTAPPQGLDAIAPFLAFDLRTAKSGPVGIWLPRVEPFGDVRVEGRAGAVGPEGEQVLELKLSRRPIRPGAEAARDHAHWSQTMFGWGLSGTLRLVRQIDRKRGLVTGFTAAFELVHRNEKDPLRRATRATVDQRWTLRDVVERRDPKFQARVLAAIEKGRAFVRREISNPRAKRCAVDAENSRGAGYLALALLTLLKAELPRDDAVIRAGFEELRKRVIRNTYSVALALMATEALYAPYGERQAILSGQRTGPQPRKVPAGDRKLMEGWAATLLANRDQSVDVAYLSRWNYTPARRYDNSNTQYALLGLYSAQLCGVKVSRGVWIAAANHLLADRRPAEGPTARFQLTDHRAAAVLDGLSPKERARRSRASLKAVPRGWSYWDDENELAYGSMTAAGISGLTICRAVLGAQKGGNPLLRKIDDAIRGGFAWLSLYPDMRSVCGRNTWRRDSRYRYFLYGYERACELSGVARIDGRDWYFDGAHLLLAVQKKDGAIGGRGLADNCFAILFLKKAVVPVLTAPR